MTCSLFATLQGQCLQKCLKIRVHGTYNSFNGLRKNIVPPTRGSMPNQGPRSEYVHCNNNMLANPNAMQVPCFGTISGTTVSKATDHGSKSAVTAPNPHSPKATANRSRPPFRRVHGPRAGALELGRWVHWEGVLFEKLSIGSLF